MRIRLVYTDKTTKDKPNGFIVSVDLAGSPKVIEPLAKTIRTEMNKFKSLKEG